MPTKKISLETALQTNFKDCTEDHLSEYCQELGIPVTRRMDAEGKKAAILDKFADVSKLVHGKVEKVAPEIGDRINPSSLVISSGLQWGGRWVRVELMRDSGQQLVAPRMIHVETSEIYVPMGKIVDIPEPHYNALESAEIERLHSQPDPDKPWTIKKWTDWVPYIAYRGFGFTAGTEDRPENLMAYYQAKGEAWFKKLDDRQILQLSHSLGYPKRHPETHPMNQPEGIREFLTTRFGYGDPADQDLML